MIFTVRLDTFVKEDQTKVFYIGTNDPSELTEIRCHMLDHFKDLPIYAEYLHRGAFDIAEKYGKDTFLTIRYLGGDWLLRLFALKGWFDALANRLKFIPGNLSDEIMHWISSIFPHHLPGKLKEYRDKYAHHLLLKMSGNGIRDAQPFLESIFSSSQGDFFECPNDEGEKAPGSVTVRSTAARSRTSSCSMWRSDETRFMAICPIPDLVAPRVCNWNRADRHGITYSPIAVHVIPFLMLLYLVTLTGSNKLNLAE